MLQRARTSAKPTPTRTQGGAGPSPDKQSQLGNAALVERSSGKGASPGVSDAEAQSWIREPEAGAELSGADTAAGPMRATKLRRGQKGALIGDGDEVTLAATETGTAGESVAKGSAAEVMEIKGERIRVKVRKVEGWVDAGVFSDQPALTKDDDDKSLADDYVYSEFEGDQSPTAPEGKQTAQGAAGNCFLIASLAAVANASPQVIKDMVKYNKEKGTYTVRFQEETGRDRFTPVFIEVDGYLPTKKENRKDPVYAGDEGGPKWSAIIEKAYAKWKGGYDVIGEGGTGSTAMAEITGARSQSKSPSSMREEDVIPYFEAAKKEGQAIYAGVKDARKADTQTPFSGSADGPYKGKVTQTHRWNEIIPGSVQVRDAKGQAPSARDRGAEGDKSGTMTGNGVKSGSVGYTGADAHNLDLTYDAGKGPAEGSDLQVDFSYHGVIDINKFIIANHAYAFEGIVGGKELQFYNPWGTWQPKPVTPGEFLDLFDSLSVNKAPASKTAS